MPVYALYNFDDTTTEALDSAPAGGDQVGIYLNGATASEGQAVLDGSDDLVKIFPDPSLQSNTGTLEIQFTLGSDPLTATQTVVSRDSTGDTQGGFRVEILANGAIQISHETGSGVEVTTTEPGFANPGDEINLTYSWDQGGEGGQVNISNLTSGDDFSAPVSDAVTMDMGAISQPYAIGAGQSNSTPDLRDNIDQHFQGTVEVFSLSDTVDNVVNNPDGIVSGTGGDDLIDTAYTGDPDGDRIDFNDALLPGDGPQDDRVLAGDGNDTVLAGQGDDSVEGGAGDDYLGGGVGDDSLFGQQGFDTLVGDGGNDLITGGINNDVVSGGTGNDTIIGGRGMDTQSGGDDRDVFLGGNAGDVVDGNEGGDDFDTLDLSGLGPIRIVYDSSNAENGTVQLLDADRNVTGTLTFTNIENVIPCFTPGTMIATPRGEVPVESLRPGDKIVTRDNGLQEIRWMGSKSMSWADLAANVHMKPILIKQGCLGNGLPERDMMVSPNHRLLVANDRTALYFDEHEVLVAAKHLTGGKGLHSIDAAGVTYVHFMFDRHEVVLSNGSWTESFQPGDYTLKGMGNAQRSEILELFPELATAEGLDGYYAARRTLKKHEAALLIK